MTRKGKGRNRWNGATFKALHALHFIANYPPSATCSQALFVLVGGAL